MTNQTIPKFKDSRFTEIHEILGERIYIYKGQISCENMGTYTATWPSDGNDGLAKVKNGMMYAWVGSDAHNNEQWMFANTMDEIQSEVQRILNENENCNYSGTIYLAYLIV